MEKGSDIRTFAGLSAGPCYGTRSMQRGDDHSLGIKGAVSIVSYLQKNVVIPYLEKERV